MAVTQGATELIPDSGVGRRFSLTRRVRLGDVNPRGRLRLDAAARYLQDVANDDAAAAGLVDSMFWVVRRALIEVVVPPAFDEEVDIRTWCGGTGSRWAERRTTIRGQRGGLLEAAVVWVRIDRESGAPRKLGEEFHRCYGEAAGGRRVRARLVHAPPGPGSEVRPWPLRAVDFDLMGHVNNAVYWEAVEEELAIRRWGGRVRASVEYGGGIDPGSDVSLVRADREGGFDQWFVVEGEVKASTSVSRLVQAGSGTQAGRETPPVCGVSPNGSVDPSGIPGPER